MTVHGRAIDLRRGGVLAGLSLAVLAAHLAVGAWVADAAAGFGASAVDGIRRMDVAFVQELVPTVDATVAPAVLAAAMGAVVPRPPARAASAPKRAERKPAPRPPPALSPVKEPETALAQAPTAATADDLASLPPSPLPPSPLPALTQGHGAPDLPPRAASAAALSSEAMHAEAADMAATPASAPEASTAVGTSTAAPTSVAASASAAAMPLEWPPSTRLSYTLVGDYRGPVHGTAGVEWIRRGDRYQVHLEVSVGPLVSRRMSSEGRLGENGLEPQRYEEVTEGLMMAPRRHVVRFEPGRIVLANGQSVAHLPGVQDTASQFVQMTWMFITQRQRLALGETLEMPLALPRVVDRWLYDVQAEEELDTPVGRLKTFHMRPRRAQPRPGELAMESWIAPGLQHLPARILIRQDAQTYVDLTLQRLPQQALSAPAR